MYTPGMSVMSLLLKNRYEIKRIEISFMEKENAFTVTFLFLQKKKVPSIEGGSRSASSSTD
jgi:hypothetical protein